jgi:hypothetical protein
MAINTRATGLSDATLFGKLWAALSDLLGTAATAAMVSRATRRAQLRSPELEGLIVERVDRDYTYALPNSFERAGGPTAALLTFLDELRQLIEEQTGRIVLITLARVPELREWATNTLST